MDRQTIDWCDKNAEEAKDAIELAPGWEKPLLSSFIEAIEYTAAMRGAARWEP